MKVEVKKTKTKNALAQKKCKEIYKYRKEKSCRVFTKAIYIIYIFEKNKYL